jgi:glycosyltransferase involved in cell wall biosynthesis
MNKFETKENAASIRATVTKLTIAIPFYNYDALPLCLELCQQASHINGDVEILLADDGSPATSLSNAIADGTVGVTVPVKVLRFFQNAGRAEIRNQLCLNAKGEYILYLDCDMLPDGKDFLVRYMEQIAVGVSFAFGGRSAIRCGGVGPELALHRYFTEHYEQVPPHIRDTAPAFYFMSSNFIIKKTLLQDIPLDPAYRGWGWEDCEWAYRVSKHCELVNLDNTASHMGLLTVDQILSKYDESVANFARTLDKHPQLLHSTRLFKVASTLRRVHGGAIVKAIARVIVKSSVFPLSSRTRALQFYKAALYSKAI